MKREKIKKVISIAVAYYIEQEKKNNLPVSSKWASSGRKRIMRNRMSMQMRNRI